MHPGFTTPLLDQFRRGESSRDVRLMAACGGFDLRAREQVGLLLLLLDDPDADVAAAAGATIDRLPRPRVEQLLARSETPAEIKRFFAERGVQPAATAAADDDEPLLPVETAEAEVEAQTEAEAEAPKALSAMTVPERLKAAMRGTREQRSQLIRDPNKLVATAVLASPKVTLSEIEGFCRMGNVSDEVLRIIGTNRGWTKSYPVMAALARNPKTPPGIALALVPRLNPRDLKQMSVDRNLPEVVRLSARKIVSKQRE